MQHNPQAFRLIANLLAAWEKEGFAVGIETQLQLRELTQKLPDDINIQNLKTLFAPLFANTRDEQELFYELFDKNLKENEQFFKESVQYIQLSKPIDTPSVKNRFKWFFIILSFVLLAILAYFIYKKYYQSPLPPPPTIKYTDLSISIKDKGEHLLLFNQYGDSLKNINLVYPEKINKNVSIKIKDSTQLYYEALSEGIDTVCLQFCFDSRLKCDTVYYRFIVADVQKPKDGVVSILDTLAFKPYNHQPDIATLIPTEKMRFGFRYAYWDWWKIGIFLGVLAWILLISKWLNRRKQLIFKDLKGNDKAPYAWTVKIEGVDKIGLNDIFYTASNQLRRRSDNEISRFDVPRTVTATIKQAGRVNFQYRQLTQSNEYLLLIDMPSAANHQAQLFNFLNKALSDNEVLVDRFFYDGDIRLCWNETHKRGISLKDLQHHYSEHRLIIVGSGHSFLSPLTGKLAKWATIFDHWRTKALFSTRPASEWDMREAQLSQKFRVLPASLKGIGELVETIEAVEAKDYRLWKSIKDPSVQPLRLPDSLTDDELMTVLKAEFMRYNNRQADDRLVQWIAACAVYPTLHWDLTLALAPPAPQGGEFQKQHGSTPPFGGQGGLGLLTLDNLFIINRLSWFIDGKMPEPVRKTLLKWLAETHPSVLEHIRQQLSDILKNCQPPSDSIAYEDYRLQMVMNELLLKPDARQRKALETELEKLLALDAEQDFLVAEYLNRPRTPLDFVVPDNLRKYVRVQEPNRLPRTPQWIWQSLIAVPTLICLWFLNPYLNECDGSRAILNNTYYCLKTPQDSLTFNEYNFCNNVEMGIDVRLLEQYDHLIKVAQDSLNSNPARKDNFAQMIANLKDAKETNIQLFAQKGYPQNASMEDILLTESFNLIRQNALDSASFYRNIPIAYWNAGVLHYNKSLKIPSGISPKLRGLYKQSQLDSACIFLNKLNNWAWRDSVLAQKEFAFISKTCYPDFQQNQVTELPKDISCCEQSTQLRPFKEGKKWGYKNEKGEIFIIAQFGYAYEFAECMALISDEANKYGYIDCDGKIVIPPQYKIAERFKNGLARVTTAKETFFIDKTGKRITESPIDTRQMPSVSSDTGRNIATQTALPNSKNKPIEGETVFVAGRNFQMGCDEKRDAPCEENEKPVHYVTLSSYNIGKYEVTNEEYVIFLNDYGNDYQIDGLYKNEKLIYENKWGIAFHGQGDITTAYYDVQKGYEKYPVVGVTWYGAVAYCEWISKKTGLKYRLPTEAEWEYAARGGIKSNQYPYSGSNKIDDVAWYAANSGNKTHAVGTKASNELDIHDMSGNVWEWCSDSYDKDYYKFSPTQNPKGGQGSNRVLRGGSSYSLYNICRSAMRNSAQPSQYNDFYGFRLVIGY